MVKLAIKIFSSPPPVLKKSWCQGFKKSALFPVLVRNPVWIQTFLMSQREFLCKIYTDQGKAVHFISCPPLVKPRTAVFTCFDTLSSVKTAASSFISFPNGPFFIPSLCPHPQGHLGHKVSHIPGRNDLSLFFLNISVYGTYLALFKYL